MAPWFYTIAHIPSYLASFNSENTMKKLSILGLAAAAVFASSATVALADAGADLFQAKTCWSCHGKDANTPIMPVYPKLCGQNADYAFNQMKDIKDGKRNNGQTAAMRGVMGLVSEDEMKSIAAWLSHCTK